MRGKCRRSDADPSKLMDVLLKHWPLSKSHPGSNAPGPNQGLYAGGDLTLISITGAHHVTPVVLFTLVSGGPGPTIGCHISETGSRWKSQQIVLFGPPQQDLRGFQSSSWVGAAFEREPSGSLQC